MTSLLTVLFRLDTPDSADMFRSLFLMNPPEHQLLEGFPGSLVPLAGFVADREPDVLVGLCDFGRLPIEKLDEAVSEVLRSAPSPTLVGVTTTTASYRSALAVAASVKRVNAEAFVVFGGHHATPQDEIILKHHDDVDAVIRGEGERAMLALVRSGRAGPDVPSLTWRDRYTLRRNPLAPRLTIQELDSLPVNFHEEDIHTAAGKFHTVTYVSARGCPLSCHFCSVANEGIRAKSVDRVIEDLRVLVEVNGHRRVALEDNFFAASKRRTFEICAAIEAFRRTGPSFTWDCQTRLESVRDPEIVAAMERAGCEAVYLGVESLDPEHLQYLGKTADPERYLRILEQDVLPRLAASRIDPYINLQLGIPGDTPSRRTATLRLLARLGAIAARRGRQITIFPQLHVVYPGTRHFIDAVQTSRFGPMTQSIFEPFTEWERDQQPVLTWLGEHFAHGTGGVPEGILAVAPLREGRFEVEGDQVAAVSNHLDEIKEIASISLFQYKTYLTASTDELAPTSVTR